MSVVSVWPRLDHDKHPNALEVVVVACVCAFIGMTVAALLVRRADDGDDAAAPPRRAGPAVPPRPHNGPPWVCRWLHRPLGGWRREDADGRRYVHCRCGRSYSRKLSTAGRH